jgi:hypothetical protein
MARNTQWTWVGTASGILFVVTQFAGFGAGAAARDFKRITLTSPSSEVAESIATPVPTAAWVGWSPNPWTPKAQSDTMGNQVEARPERQRNHLRRPDADEDQLIMKPPLTPLIGQTPPWQRRQVNLERFKAPAGGLKGGLRR